ncbi:MAG: hypothetical protein M3Z66_05960 [Chloroflexota bacterium]|nr:hypothetical protein [Chloroflexota bacterium]
MVWLDAGSHQLRPWDRVLLDWDGRAPEGRVVVCPEQLVRSPKSIEGAITGVAPVEAEGSFRCADKLSDLPPLGSIAGLPVGSGTVVQIDPVRRIVMVRTPEDGLIQVALSELLPPGPESPQPTEQPSALTVLSDE